MFTMLSARALSCCRHRTRLPQEHAISCVRTCISEGTPIGHEQRHGRAMLSAQVRRTCVQHRRSERAWNSIPADLRATLNTATFKKNLKTFLFCEAYSSFWLNSCLLHCFIVSFIFSVLYFFVIGLVGLCCKPQPLVIIIIITKRNKACIQISPNKQQHNQKTLLTQK